MSVGYHLTAYGGRDDGLFRGGIMESGGSISAMAQRDESYYQDSFDKLASQVDCANAEDKLQCLREVPFEKLNSALNGTGGSPAYEFSPVLDGDFVKTRGSAQLDKHEFIHVPIIAGTNSDEGTSFGPTGINTTDQFYGYLTGILSLILNIPYIASNNIPQATHPILPFHHQPPTRSSSCTPMTHPRESQRT